MESSQGEADRIPPSELVTPASSCTKVWVILTKQGKVPLRTDPFAEFGALQQRGVLCHLLLGELPVGAGSWSRPDPWKQPSGD